MELQTDMDIFSARPAPVLNRLFNSDQIRFEKNGRHASAGIAEKFAREVAGAFLCKRLHFGLALVLTASPLGVAAAAPGTVALAPHRAVYDMVLSPAAGLRQDNVGKGRMVYEIRGAECAGYSISMRWVTERRGAEGGRSLEDLQYVSWEAGNGDNFTFSSTRYLNGRLVEEMESSATKNKYGKAGEIQLNMPKKSVAPLPAGTLFPTEHFRMVIADALAGKTVRNDNVYDVSDDGKSIYDTFTLVTPLAESVRKEGLATVPSLRKLQSWSANISYFLDAEGASGEKVPDFEQTFSLFANGVSTRMRLGTPNIVIDATLSEIEFLPKTTC